MALVLTICNTKGGTMKSGLSSLTALTLHERGVVVALLDTDFEQRTSSLWVQRAAPDIPVAVAGKPQDIKTIIHDLKRHTDLVIVDTPGSATPASFTATLLADIAIVPLQPSETDVEALDKALTTIAVAHEATGATKPEVFIVLTLTAVRDIQARNLRRELEANQLYKVAQSEIRRFVLLRGAMGKSLSKMRGKEARKAQADLDSLIQEVLGGRIPSIEPPAGLLSKRVAANE